MKKQVFHIDTNLLNARQKNAEMNELEKMDKEELITLVWSETSQGEALNKKTEIFRKKANAHIYTINESENEDGIALEDPMKQRIFEIMEINHLSSQNEVNDAEIVYEAHKYGAILITNDGASKSQPKGMLGRRDELRDYVKIVNPTEALSLAKGAEEKVFKEEIGAERSK